ncbi:hypothetical protein METBISCDRAFT_29003 [Metschnikowia bicuspidata]|uniref:Uncharacterized protein n=1 Tax=Metschnikowia bicuspidata TaxID=27322 RepID=A0A4P9Z7H4_9ASCO|nr:hypothetical protein METBISCDRAFT_29003 [Metschnikowia bicuspidata]
MALDFLRMDIKNVNDFFSRKKINVYPERLLFKYITESNENLGLKSNSDEALVAYLDKLPLKSELNDSSFEDEVFRSLHLVRSLNHLEERDFDKFREGKVDTLTNLVPEVDNQPEMPHKEIHPDDLEGEEREEEDGDEEEQEFRKHRKSRQEELKGKKYENKDDKRVRKLATKEAKAEKRLTKMKKHFKKKLVNKRKTT